jgi:flagellar FliL protein
MATADARMEPPPKTSLRRPLLIGLVAALLLGGGTFYATYSGLLAGNGAKHGAEGEEAVPLPDIAFVPIEQMVLSLGPAAASKYLRFTASLEVASTYADEVTLLMPRILDVLNGYLRAVDSTDLEDPAALVRLRAQMLRRIQIVTGEGRVRDLLVTEFVLN